MQTLCFWYRRAFEAGVLQAGIVFAKLILAHPELASIADNRIFAVNALHIAAKAGLGEAQWLWAQHRRGALFNFSSHDAAPTEEVTEPLIDTGEPWQKWAERAAAQGVEAARHALEEELWEKKDYSGYLQWALLPARGILQAMAHSKRVAGLLSERDRVRLKRCAWALENTESASQDEIERIWTAAAQAGDAQAQFTLGLAFAKLDSAGRRQEQRAGRVNYKKALRWLSAAADQGLAEAHYAIAKIYFKPEFSGCDSELAHHHLQLAAQAGYLDAQLEWGLRLWQRGNLGNEDDVHALYWLMQAAEQGSGKASEWVARIAPAGSALPWAQQACDRLGAEQKRLSPYLAARVDLARRFGLSRAEALLLDINQADRGHCLVIDIRKQRPRSKRRLIALHNEDMKQSVSRLRRLFHEVDGSEQGPEGNYRQRLYRLKNLSNSNTVVRAVPGLISRFRLQTRSLPGRSS